MVLRSLVAKGAGDQEILETRRTLMKEVYDILSIALGSPVKKFDFKYRDRDKEYHVDRDMTPQAFYDKYVGLDLDRICICYKMRLQKTSHI